MWNGVLMKILIVEDDMERVRKFKEMFSEYYITHVVDAISGIDFVKKQKFDAIFLDHDLGNKVFVKSEDHNTGYQVAKVIPLSINKTTPVVVHSWNPAGADNILKLLPNAVYKPFGSFSSNILTYIK